MTNPTYESWPVCGAEYDCAASAGRITIERRGNGADMITTVLCEDGQFGRGGRALKFIVSGEWEFHELANALHQFAAGTVWVTRQATSSVSRSAALSRAEGAEPDAQ